MDDFAGKVTALIQEMPDNVESAVCIMLYTYPDEDGSTGVTFTKATHHFDAAYATYLMALLAAEIAKAGSEEA